MTRTTPTTTGQQTHRWRYFRVSSFFFLAFSEILWFDFFMNRPILRWFRGQPIKRWTRIAAQYRELASRLGGVLIKLGQYLSTRVDILPLEVTRQLADLQDEVPEETFADIRHQVELELGGPVQEIFNSFMEKPLGAASFAQVHEAQLKDGRPVVVKVLRPGIEDLVEVDLRALHNVLVGLNFFAAIRRRVDLKWFEEEFGITTRRELDLRQEGGFAERFAENFADQLDVHIPEIHWDYTSRRVLTEENVAYIKINDFEGLRENGIDPRDVAKKLYRIYMQQIFVHNFVHADPHPGNIFVRPIPSDGSLMEEFKTRASDAAEALGVEDHLPFEPSGSPFQILFIDFGMVAEIPPRLRAALRKYLIGIGNRDAALVIQALRDSGSLLPGADLGHLEEALEAVFDRFWGLDMSDISRVGLQEATNLWSEFGALLRETPIQVQVDFIFTGRAIELLTGITKALDDAFNPWSEAIPFAQKLAFEELTDWRVQGRDLVRQTRAAFRLPNQLHQTLGMMQRGRLTTRSALAPDTRARLVGLENAIRRLGNAVAGSALLIVGTMIYESHPDVALGLMSISALVFLLSK